MPEEAVHMRQVGEALVGQPHHLRSSYLGRALGTLWEFVALARPLRGRDQRPDGLEALDMLGGWKGSDAGRRAP